MVCSAKSSTEEFNDFEEVCIEDERDSSGGPSKTSQKAYLDELSDRALEAASRSDKIVLRYATNSSCQDALVKRLIVGGASQENITVVRLAMDDNAHRNKSFYQTNYCMWRPKTLVA